MKQKHRWLRDGEAKVAICRDCGKMVSAHILNLGEVYFSRCPNRAGIHGEITEWEEDGTPIFVETNERRRLNERLYIIEDRLESAFEEAETKDFNGFLTALKTLTVEDQKLLRRVAPSRDQEGAAKVFKWISDIASSSGFEEKGFNIKFIEF